MFCVYAPRRLLRRTQNVVALRKAFDVLRIPYPLQKKSPTIKSIAAFVYCYVNKSLINNMLHFQWDPTFFNEKDNLWLKFMDRECPYLTLEC